MRRGAIVLIVALVLLGGALVALFLRNYDLVEETRATPMSGEARTNHFRALELLLTEMGAPARDVIGWNRLPPNDHALMLLGTRFTEADQRTERLLEWVESGGHLVVVPQAVYDVALDHRACEEEYDYDEYEAYEETVSDQDPGEIFKDSEDVSVDDGQYWSGIDEDGDRIDEPVADPITDPIGIRVEIPKHDVWLDSDAQILVVETERGQRRILVDTHPALIDVESKAAFRGRALVESPDQAVTTGAASEDTSRSYLLRHEYGNGLVTAVNDTELFTNLLIGDNDHAAFAWDVVAPPNRKPAGVWIVGRDRYPGLMEVLREHALLALLGGFLLLVTYLWHKGTRLGPPIRDALPERRSVLEHIAATADFYWRSKMPEVLLDSTRRSALRRLENRDPSYAQLGDNERIEHLSELSGISRAQLRRALSDHAADDPTEFTRIVRTLEKLSRTTTK